MPDDSNLDLTDENIMSADFLFLYQTELAELFEVMVGDAWTTEMKSPLNFADTNWLAVLEKVPINFPRFAT
jgi:hypothetical protein